MINKIKETIREYKMFQKGDRILVAVSGGPDSVCLLSVLYELKKEFGYRLYLAHLNHGIRKEEAGADVNYVKRLSRRFNLPVYISKMDVPRIAKEKGDSIETAAREARYHFLTGIASKKGINKIALGHNRDDLVETFLINFLRGAGMAGLSGIPAKRKIYLANDKKNIEIVRPLIRIRRDEITRYLNERKFRPRLDSSNLEVFYRRNKIRWKLLPFLEKEYNANIKDVITRTARIFEKENLFWKNYLSGILKEIVTKKNSKTIHLDVKKLLSQEEAVQNRAIQEVLKQFAGDLKGFNYEHIMAIRELCRKEKGRKFLVLPREIQVVKDYRKLILEKYRLNSDSSYEYPVKIAGTNFLFHRSVRLKADIKTHDKDLFKKHVNNLKLIPPGEKFESMFDRDKLDLPLTVRNRRPGDKFQPLGFNSYIKLKDYFINKKISRLDRNSIPLLVDTRKRIIWVMGYEIADWAKVTENTGNILRVKYSL